MLKDNKMINIIMPMAGRGSRFEKMGYKQPKPLINLGGMPFFWWAVKGLLSSYSGEFKLIFIVLQNHIDDYQIDKEILKFFTDSEIVAIPSVTNGALETAVLGLKNITNEAPVLINDCDHYFKSVNFDQHIEHLQRKLLSGFLCTFPSDSPKYSYAKFTNEGYLIKTAEKQVISPRAIAGAYAFSSATVLFDNFEDYKTTCPYDELYVSGIFNNMVLKSHKIQEVKLDTHISFGTPDEFMKAKQNKSILVRNIRG